MRAVAALAVLAIHLNGWPAYLVPKGDLAVDLFFVLSGFVLAHAYSKRRLTLLAFLQIRLIRLYPLYLVGFLLGFVTFALEGSLDRTGIEASVLGLLFLPAYGFPPGAWLYPLNPPAWSLFFELVINALWFAALPFLSARVLKAALLCGALLITATIIIDGNVGTGATSTQFLGGFCRVFYSFFAGVAANRIWGAMTVRFRPPAWIVIAFLCAMLVAPVAGPTFDIVAVLVLCPALVFLGACSVLPRWAEELADGSGRASYAIYILHWPVIALVAMSLHPWLANLTHPGFISSPAACCALAALVWLADRFYDAPVRRWLTEALMPAVAPR